MFALCCHSIANATRAPTANLPNSAQLGASPTTPQVKSGPCPVSKQLAKQLSKKNSASLGLSRQPHGENFCLANRSLTGHGPGSVQRRSEGGAGGAGRTRRHLLWGGKLAKIVKKNHVKLQIVSFICLRVQ